MRIVSLQAENVKKLRLVDITPNRFINRISGANGSGKTSVLDAIEWALTGAKSIPTLPVRRGSSRAVIRLDLGEIIVTRRMVEGSPKRQGFLTVESKDGKKWSNPDEMLRSLLTAVTFDPLEFIHMKPNDQFDALRNIAMPDVDLEALEAKIKADYDARTETKKQHRMLQDQRKLIEDVPANLPTEKIDEAGLVAELQSVAEYNASIERERERLRKLQERGEKLRAENEERDKRIWAMEEEIRLLRIEIRNVDNEASDLLGEVERADPLPDPKDSSEIAERINEARGINRGIDRKVTIDKMDAQIAAKAAEVDALDDSYKRGELRHREAIALAKFPVDGLGFGIKEVLYNGLPFDQASNAEQIKVSVGIGMANNPQLRVMRIKDGSLLDDKSLDLIASMAQTSDFQIWIEQVDTTGKIGVYLEDGEVKAINEEPKDQPPTAPAARPRRKKKEKTAQ